MQHKVVQTSTILTCESWRWGSHVLPWILYPSDPCAMFLCVWVIEQPVADTKIQTGEWAELHLSCWWGWTWRGSFSVFMSALSPCRYPSNTFHNIHTHGSHTNTHTHTELGGEVQMLRYRGDEVEGQTVGPNGVNDDDHLWISSLTISTHPPTHMLKSLLYKRSLFPYYRRIILMYSHLNQLICTAHVFHKPKSNIKSTLVWCQLSNKSTICVWKHSKYRKVWISAAKEVNKNVCVGIPYIHM